MAWLRSSPARRHRSPRRLPCRERQPPLPRLHKPRLHKPRARQPCPRSHRKLFHRKCRRPRLPTPAAEPAPRRGQTVRVNLADARRLLDGLSEGGLRVASVQASLERLEALEGTGTADMRQTQRAIVRVSMADELDRLNRQIGELHGIASQLRMATSESLLLEAGRVVRATAAATGKPVRCVTHGEAERVELPILDAMGDALLHLVRNAVAHGVEPAAERRAAGKTETATITIEVSRIGRDAVFTCADDGRGIAVEPIRRIALERGLMSAAEAAAASDEDLLQLLLRPGFSLSGQVDELAGRGVGLDAVREAAVSVRGHVAIESIVGRGTTFRISVPQTAFAVRTLQVEASGRCFELPVAGVEQTFRMEPHHIKSAERTRTLPMGRDSMPFAWLEDAFPAAAFPGERTSAACLVLSAGPRKLALGVDRLLGLDDVLVSPVARFAGVAAYVAGSTLAAGREPRIVLDTAALLDFFAGGKILPRSEAALTRQQRRLPILVIDDSLTTRMLEQSILEAEGYEVELATSAEMGLDMAHRKAYALFLVDVEMPGMNGFEFVAVTRADEQLKSTPAILVTSLDSAEHRERGRAAGAYSYIVKGEFNQQVYLDRIRTVVGGRA